MPDASDSANDSQSLHNVMAEKLFRFEAAWQSGDEPNIDEYVAADSPVRIKLLTELVLIDLEYRINAGELARVESYLDRYPELQSDALATMELIAGEFGSRLAEQPSIDDFADRFPSYRAELSVRLNESGRRKRLRMNCPHCRNPIVCVVEEGESEAVCSVCGSSFEVDARIEVSWSPKKLPQLGKFQLLEVVGRGAFGTVYRARDTDLDRIVAAKVPRSGQFSSQEDEDRFVREARSVAQLNHPGIVPVYEVGRSEDLPYIIAEFVDGVPLNELLRSRRLRFEESADIVASIAEALQHAHGRGVIHRDLKPANIMLERLGGTERDVSMGGSLSEITRSQTIRSCGRARLMDFGLARRDNGEITVTMEGQLLGTPAYMSPEQARGSIREIDATSDVYSLGVMLYEMLTGELPFRGSSRMVMHQVIHDEPVTPRKFVSHLPGDLETICLKCMEKDRAKRYQSAGELNAELGRFLNGQPILARPISSLDRALRWSSRNRVVTLLVVALLFSLLAGFTGVVTQWRRAEQNAENALAEAERANSAAQLASAAAEAERVERRKAEQAEIKAESSAALAQQTAETAQEVSDFMVQLFHGADRFGFLDYQFGPTTAEDANPTATQLLARGRARLDTELKDQPVVRAALKAKIAQVYLSLGSFDDAESMLLSALDTQRKHQEEVSASDFLETLTTLGVIQYAYGNYDASLEYLREAIAKSDEAYGEMDPRGGTAKLVRAMVSMEAVGADRGDWIEAKRLFRQVVEIREAQEDVAPYDLAHAYIGEAIVARTNGNTGQAFVSLGKAAKQLIVSRGGGEYMQAWFLGIQATVNWQNKNSDLALKQTEQLMTLLKEMLGEKHPAVSHMQIDFAWRMYAAGENELSEVYLRDGIRRAREAYGRQPRTAYALYRLGSQLMNRKTKLEEAEAFIRESKEIYSEVLGPDHRRTVNAEKQRLKVIGLLEKSQAAGSAGN